MVAESLCCDQTLLSLKKQNSLGGNAETSQGEDKEMVAKNMWSFSS